MIIEKILSLFLSLPFFNKFTFSDATIDSVKKLSGYFYQLNSFLNLNLLVETLVLAFALYAVVAIVNLIRSVI